MNEIKVKDFAPDQMSSEEIAAEADRIIESEKKTFEGVPASDLPQFLNAGTDWIVDYVFAADQPTVFGARSKATKTTQLIDLSVALATKTKWLNHFHVSKIRRVLFITGESNYRAAAKRISRACKARRTTLAAVGEILRVEAVDFPQLPSQIDREAIFRTVERHNIDVVIVDPLYRGLSSLDTNKMAEMGQAIVEFSKACMPASLIISHHSTKTAAREYGQPPELEDLSGAGIAESCGNWWLLGRNEKYGYDEQHDLCVSYGGRDEQSGARRILFDETTWTFTVESFGEYLEARKDQVKNDKKKKQAERRQAKANEAKAAIKACMMKQKTPQSQNQIFESVSGGRAPFNQAWRELVNGESIVSLPYRDSRNRVQQSGWIFAEYATDYKQLWAEFEDFEDSI